VTEFSLASGQTKAMSVGNEQKHCFQYNMRTLSRIVLGNFERKTIKTKETRNIKKGED
jgi:hypothetical protein